MEPRTVTVNELAVGDTVSIRSSGVTYTGIIKEVEHTGPHPSIRFVDDPHGWTGYILDDEHYTFVSATRERPPLPELPDRPWAVIQTIDQNGHRAVYWTPKRNTWTDGQNTWSTDALAEYVRDTTVHVLTYRESTLTRAAATIRDAGRRTIRHRKFAETVANKIIEGATK